MRRTNWILAVGLAVALLATGGAIAAEGADLYEVDASHGLAMDASISDFRSDGIATGDVDDLDASLTIAEKKRNVGRSDVVVPLDTTTDFLRVEYREDIDRTLRIWIPSEYMTPYVRESVDAVGSDHVATVEPARGDYLQVVVRVTEPGTVVIPLEKDKAASYSILGSYRDRAESVTGEETEWQYLDRDELADEHTTKIEVENTDTVLLQYDVRPDDPQETWVNVPEGKAARNDGVYYYTPESQNGTVYLVTQGETPPGVRLKQNAGPRDRVTGAVRDARENVNRIVDRLNGDGDDDILPW